VNAGYWIGVLIPAQSGTAPGPDGGSALDPESHIHQRVDADRRSSYTRRVRVPGRPSGETTVFELFAWAVLLTLVFPLAAVVLVIRYRVVESIIAGYRDGASAAAVRVWP
jgi:hypothetical protein